MTFETWEPKVSPTMDSFNPRTQTPSVLVQKGPVLPVCRPINTDPIPRCPTPGVTESSFETEMETPKEDGYYQMEKEQGMFPVMQELMPQMTEDAWKEHYENGGIAMK